MLANYSGGVRNRYLRFKENIRTAARDFGVEFQRSFEVRVRELWVVAIKS